MVFADGRLHQIGYFCKKSTTIPAETDIYSNCSLISTRIYVTCLNRNYNSIKLGNDGEDKLYYSDRKHLHVVQMYTCNTFWLFFALGTAETLG